ncbi:Rpn family recombination-promoting nuclease/putative transposase [Paracidovorax citrulli]
MRFDSAEVPGRSPPNFRPPYSSTYFVPASSADWYCAQDILPYDTGANARQHDASYKLLFSFREMVADLIRGFLPDAGLATLDFDSLEPVSSTFVSDGLRQGCSDAVWRIDVEGHDTPLYLLLEFQSRYDVNMPARMLSYAGLFYRDMARRIGTLGSAGYPPILPIVLYNGERPWLGPTDIRRMIPHAPAFASEHQPRLNYVLIDARRHDDADLASRRNLLAAIIRLEKGGTAEEVAAAAQLARELASHNPSLDKALSAWLASLFRRESEGKLQLSDVENLMEVTMALSPRFERWGREYAAVYIAERDRALKEAEEARKSAQALQQHLAKALCTLLHVRFGTLSERTVQRIETATPDQVQLWTDNAISAASLRDVFERER